MKKTEIEKLKENKLTQELCDAAQDGYVDVVRLLLDRGAEVNGKTIGGWTPIHYAAWYGHVDVATLLLGRGAEVNVKDNAGLTPIHYAAWYAHADVVRLLLDRGAEVNVKGNDGWTPLHDAAQDGYVDVVRLLLDRGAEVNGKTIGGWTPIHYAAWYAHADVATLLLDRGAEVNVKDNEGWTPLHHAAEMGHIEIVALLLDYGAEINCEIKFKNGKGETALGLAKKQEIRNYLVKRGAKKEEEKGEFFKKGEIGYDTTMAGVITSCEIVSTILEHTSVVVISKMLDDKRNISSIVVNKYMQFSFFSLVFFDKSDVEIKLIYVHTKASALRVEKLLTGALNKILQYLAGQKISTTDNVDAPVRQNYDIVKKACEDALEEQKSNDEI